MTIICVQVLLRGGSGSNSGFHYYVVFGHSLRKCISSAFRNPETCETELPLYMENSNLTTNRKDQFDDVCKKIKTSFFGLLHEALLFGVSKHSNIY